MEQVFCFTGPWTLGQRREGSGDSGESGEQGTDFIMSPRGVLLLGDINCPKERLLGV